MLNQIMLTIIAGALVSCGASETSLKDSSAAETFLEGNMVVEEDITKSGNVEEISLQDEALMDEEYGVVKARKARKDRPADPVRERRARGTIAPAKTEAPAKAQSSALQLKLNQCFGISNLLSVNSAKYKSNGCVGPKKLAAAKLNQCKAVVAYDKKKVVSYNAARCAGSLNLPASFFSPFQKKKKAQIVSNLSKRLQNFR